MATNTTQGMNGAKYSGNLIMQVNAPLDDRIVVEKKEKLLEYNDYVYNGMLVVSLDDNSLWILIDKSKKSESDYSGWKKLGSGGTGTYSQGKNINIDSAGNISATGYNQNEEDSTFSIDSDKTLWASEVTSGATHGSPIHKLSEKANQVELVKDELAASRLFEYLSEKTSSSDVNIYEKIVNTGSQINIPAAEHKCGNWPSIIVYFENVVVYPDIQVLSGNISISWNVTPTVTSPIRIEIIGKN